MARQISTHEVISKILNELDLLSDPDDVLSESDENFIPQGDVSKSEDDLEINSEESDIASGTESDEAHSDTEEFIAKLKKVWKTTMPPVTPRRHCNIVIESTGPTQNSDNAITLQEVFNLFLKGKIVEDICTNTNLEAINIIEEINAKTPSNKQRTWANVDPVHLS